MSEFDRTTVLRGDHEKRLIDAGESPQSVAHFGKNIINRKANLYYPVLDIKSDNTPIWPGNAEFGVCLTHDIDNVQRYSVRKYNRWRRQKLQSDIAEGSTQATRFVQYCRFIVETLAGTVFHCQSLYKSNPYNTHKRLYELENERNLPSTTFIPPSNPPNPHYLDPKYNYNDKMRFGEERMLVRDVVSQIEEMGNEIGLHPGYNAIDDVSEMQAQKQQLNNTVEDQVVSVRHHHLHFDITETPRIHEQVGLRYDSSLGIKGDVGFRYGTSKPWRLYDHTEDTKTSVIELPLIVGDVLAKSNEMDLSDDLILEYVERLATVVQNVGGVLTILWHPSKYMPHLRTYEKILDRLASMNAYFGTVSDIGEIWRKQLMSK